MDTREYYYQCDIRLRMILVGLHLRCVMLLKETRSEVANVMWSMSLRCAELCTPLLLLPTAKSTKNIWLLQNLKQWFRTSWWSGRWIHHSRIRLPTRLRPTHYWTHFPHCDLQRFCRPSTRGSRSNLANRFLTQFITMDRYVRCRGQMVCVFFYLKGTLTNWTYAGSFMVMGYGTWISLGFPLVPVG